MASNEFALVSLIMLICVLVVVVMSYVTVRAYDSPWLRGKEQGLSILLGLVWFVALSLCSVPVLIFVPHSNPNKGLIVAVIESVALTGAVSIGLAVSPTKRPSTD